MSNFQASFQLADNIDQDKVFLINLSDIDKRLDTDYYRPELLTIEKRVSAKATKKLQDFANTMASGATPSVSESSYYADKETGIPFLRVQNLTINGTLNLENVKFISHHVHENQIKRSQVSDSDLLIKITGVGRMAVASVPPKGFIGNTNQHMVVLRTNDREKSRYLANYLNLDVVEKLASRRATGGTRPALDYSALRSIPVIENINFEDLEKAKQFSFEKKLKAQNLLDSIDDYLLAELGIDVPDVDNSLSSRMFTVQASELSGGRFDAYRNKVYFQELQKVLENHTNGSVPLKKYTKNMASGQWGVDEEDGYDRDIYTKCLVIRATEFDNNGNLSFDENRIKYRLIENNKLKKMNILEHDLLIEKSGGSENQPVGRIAILTKNILNDYGNIAYSNFVQKITVNSTAISPVFLFYYLKTLHNIKFTEKMQSQTNGIRNLITSEYLDTPIINVDCQKQHEIVQHIDKVRATATQLQQEANEILAQAKQKIERMILGEEN